MTLGLDEMVLTAVLGRAASHLPSPILSMFIGAASPRPPQSAAACQPGRATPAASSFLLLGRPCCSAGTVAAMAGKFF